MNPALTAAVRPVLDDLAACGVTGFHLGDDPSAVASNRQIGALLRAPDGSGTGITVDLSEDQASRVANIAGIVQDIYIEDLSHTPWPSCTQHPTGGHPLLAVVRRGEAVWSCPVSTEVMARVGRLNPW